MALLACAAIVKGKLDLALIGVLGLAGCTAILDPERLDNVYRCDFDGECVRVSTMRGFAKERNMRRNPRVTLLCYDPRAPLRYLEIRGTVVDMTEEGARRHLDELASKYAGHPIRYFGEAIPAGFEATEIPILCRIRPTHVVAIDATASAAAR